ncbi:MAG TPA: hypothetical protein VFP27_18630 [Mycobacterium sp.]|nr:hypothetical protein [Mycobacterium sp.]
MNAVPGLTPAQILALPAMVDLRTACRALGIGRDAGYRLAATGQLMPGLPVRRIGRYFRVTRADLVTALGISDPIGVSAAPPRTALAPAPLSLVTEAASDT